VVLLTNVKRNSFGMDIERDVRHGATGYQ
jgi:hypothetical protein